MNSRLSDTEEHIYDLKDRKMGKSSNQNSRKKIGFLKNEISIRNLWNNIKQPTFT